MKFVFIFLILLTQNVFAQTDSAEIFARCETIAKKSAIETLRNEDIGNLIIK